MASGTLTVTISPVAIERGHSPTPISFPLIATQESVRIDDDHNALLDDLAAIIYKYDSWKDRLSERLFTWGVKVLMVKLPMDRDLDSEQVAWVQKKVDKLKNVILVNPMDDAPLEEPVLERMWTWEQWMLEDYQRLQSYSPFDGKLMAAATSHDFAIDMLSWIKRLPQWVHVPSSSDLVEVDDTPFLNREDMLSAESKEERQAKLFNYMLYARDEALAAKIDEEMTQPLEKTAKAVSLVWGLAKEVIQKEVAVAEQRIETHQKQVDETLAQREIIHDQRIAALNGKVSYVEQKLDIEKERSKNLEGKCEELEGTARWLRAALIQKTQEVEDVKSQNSGGGGGCIIL